VRGSGTVAGSASVDNCAVGGPRIKIQRALNPVREPGFPDRRFEFPKLAHSCTKPHSIHGTARSARA
jgi:hypothetical protein